MNDDLIKRLREKADAIRRALLQERTNLYDEAADALELYAVPPAQKAEPKVFAYGTHPTQVVELQQQTEPVAEYNVMQGGFYWLEPGRWVRDAAPVQQSLPACDPTATQCPRCNNPNGPVLGPCDMQQSEPIGVQKLIRVMVAAHKAAELMRESAAPVQHSLDEAVRLLREARDAEQCLGINETLIERIDAYLAKEEK